MERVRVVSRIVSWDQTEVRQPVPAQARHVRLAKCRSWEMGSHGFTVHTKLSCKRILI